MARSLKKLFLKTVGQFIPSDIFSYRIPVSVKGVCFINGEIILLKDERGNWDLPGGKLKRREELDKCLVRELQEELSITVEVHSLLSLTRTRVMNIIDVLVPIYYCKTKDEASQLKVSPEHFGIGTFPIDALDDIGLPDPYLQSIQHAYSLDQQLP
jgi:8-oxo-dGTP pyrophosphatase MutT (NUDIX family)